MTLNPALHNTLIDIGDACAKPGTMWAPFESFGSHGMSRFQVCVDVRQSPSGRFILRGFRASSMFVTGVPGRTKWPVAPASATAIFFAIFNCAVVKTVCGMAVCFGGSGGWLPCEVDVLL